MRKKIVNTKQTREKALLERGEKIKKAFIKEFNKIKRINESTLNESEEHWEDTIKLENGITAKVNFGKFKMFTNDSGHRYEARVNTRGLSDRDLQTVLGMVTKIDRDNSISIYKVRAKDGGTRVLMGSTKTDDIGAVFDPEQNQDYDIKQKRADYNPDLF